MRNEVLEIQCNLFFCFVFFSFLWFGVTNVFLIARKSLYDVDFKGNFFFPLFFLLWVDG